MRGVEQVRCLSGRPFAGQLEAVAVDEIPLLVVRRIDLLDLDGDKGFHEGRIIVLSSQHHQYDKRYDEIPLVDPTTVP